MKKYIQFKVSRGNESYTGWVKNDPVYLTGNALFANASLPYQKKVSKSQLLLRNSAIKLVAYIFTAIIVFAIATGLAVIQASKEPTSIITANLGEIEFTGSSHSVGEKIFRCPSNMGNTFER